MSEAPGLRDSHMIELIGSGEGGGGPRTMILTTVKLAEYWNIYKNGALSKLVWATLSKAPGPRVPTI